MKLMLRTDTAKRIVARLLLDASKLEPSHRTPVTGDSFWETPIKFVKTLASRRGSFT
jgi:hypothetical protein